MVSPLPALCKPKYIHPFIPTPPQSVISVLPRKRSPPYRSFQEAQSTPPVPAYPVCRSLRGHRVPVAISRLEVRSPSPRRGGAVRCPFFCVLSPLRYAPHPSALRAATFPPGGRLWVRHFPECGTSDRELTAPLKRTGSQ